MGPPAESGGLFFIHQRIIKIIQYFVTQKVRKSFQHAEPRKKIPKQT